MKTLVLTGGGTAGHVIPSLALLPYLRPYFSHIYFVGGTDGMEQRLADAAGLPFFGTQTVRFERRLWWNNARIPHILHHAASQVYDYLRQIGCDAVFSKGGYCALPTVVAAHWARIPIVCHESDATLGLANRFSRAFTGHMLTSFPHTRGGTYMGNPIRDEILQGDASRCPSFPTRRPVLLVMGGSLGAQAINDALLAAMPLLGDWNVVNIYGRSPVTYAAPNYVGLPYVDNMGDYLAMADVVVCRAGANTLFELATLAKPTVMIPLPKGASRGDQVQNALYFAAHYGFCHLPQQDLSPTTLVRAAHDALGTPPTTTYHPCNAAVARYIADAAHVL